MTPRCRRAESIQHWEAGGAPLDSLTKQKILGCPQNSGSKLLWQIRQGSMPSSTNMEATGEVTKNQGQYVPEPVAVEYGLQQRTAVADRNSWRSNPKPELIMPLARAATLMAPLG